MKTVGIIGGLGPETTSEFYLELIFSGQKFNKVNRPLIVIYSVPLPYDIEEDAIAKGKENFVAGFCSERAGRRGFASARARRNSPHTPLPPRPRLNSQFFRRAYYIKFPSQYRNLQYCRLSLWRGQCIRLH